MNGNKNGNGHLTPEQAREAFEEYLSYLPAEMAEKIRGYSERQLVRHFRGDGSDDHLESLLPRLKTISAEEILAMIFPPLPWVVPGILPPGMAVLFGQPKLGKSWLALQLAYSTSVGGKIFDRDAEKGRVLYLALEDSERRLQDRMRKQNWQNAEGVDFMLNEEFRDQIGELNSAAGRKLLFAEIDNKSYRLVVVDTFSRAIAGDQLKADEMMSAVGPIQQAALDREIVFLLIDHEPKSGGSIFGSQAKTGVIDASWRLYRDSGTQEKKLDICGRELEECSLRVVFDKQAFYWHCEGLAWEIERTEKRVEILDALEELGPCNAAKLAKSIDQDLSNTIRRLKDLIQAGQIKKRGNLYYPVLSDEEPD